MSLYQQQRVKVKEEIFSNSIRLFREKGYDNISVDEITRAVGIAKGTFYNFFSSKRDILMLWAEQEFQKFDFIGTLKPNKSIEENLYELIRYLVKAIGEETNMFKAFLNELIRIHAGKQAPDGKFDFVQIFSIVIQHSADFSIIGNTYFKEKISVLNNSLFIALIDWFNKKTGLEGLEQHLMDMLRVCLYGILKNQEVLNL